MTLSPRKREQLTAFLGSLPNAAAVNLFSALEVDRIKGGQDLPHDELLNNLRQQLLERGAALPVRKLNAKRIFFTLVEDFLIGKRVGKKRRARIARSSLDPIWRLMMTDAALSDTALAAASLDDALNKGEKPDDLERAMFIAGEAGFDQLCTEAREDHMLRERLIKELGGEPAFQDFQEIRLVLEGVDFIKQLQAAIPSPSPSLTEEQFYQLRTLFLSAHDQSPTTSVYVLLALKGRLERPWRALGVYYHLARGADERLRAAREAVSVLPNSLFEDLEAMARSLERDCAGELDAAAATLRIGYFADYADGLVRQAAKIGDNVFVNRVEACRDIAGEVHDRFAEQALSGLRAAMPVRHAGGSSRLMSLRPDYAKPVSGQIIADAAGAAALIANAAQTAERLGSDTSFTQSITEEAVEKTHIFAKDLVVEIRAAEGNERKAARRMLEHVLKIAEPLLNSDDIGLIRDRASAAAVAV